VDGSGDGVWLIELASVSDEDSVASAIAHSLRIPAHASKADLDTLIDALLPQNLLLVLDNCEHLIGACAKISDQLLRRCPNVYIIATSREPLGISGESIYRVPSLSLPLSDDPETPMHEGSDAVALFLERARAQGAELALDDTTMPLVVSICRRLDGMPLAIELAAARLRALSVADVHRLLDQRFRLLTGGSRSALERQQTLRATVDWSYSLLSEPERSILRRLSVFAESFDFDAAIDVCAFGDVESFDVTDILGSLVDKSLVVTEPVERSIRYRLLETIRQFSAERLVERGEDEVEAVAASHRAHYLALVERAETHLTGLDQGQWIAQLDLELPNIRRAIESAAGDPQGTAIVMRFVVALKYFWMARSRRDEAYRLLMTALSRSEAHSDPTLYVSALTTASVVARYVDIQAAQRLGEEAVEAARGLGDDILSVSSLVALGGAYYFGGDPERAFPLAKESLQRARALGDDILLAVTLGLAVMCSQLLDPENVEALFTEAIACTERSGNLFFTADFQNTAGVHALQQGDVAGARRHLERSAHVMELIGIATYHVKINLGLVLREEGDLAGAGSMLDEGLRISRRSGDLFGLAYSTLGLACVADDLGDWQRAAELHGVAQCFLDAVGQPWLMYYGPLRQTSVARTRARLGDEAFELAYANARVVGLEVAVDLAVSLARPR
jgi:non-specific serine/threonine protein kinase